MQNLILLLALVLAACSGQVEAPSEPVHHVTQGLGCSAGFNACVHDFNAPIYQQTTSAPVAEICVDHFANAWECDAPVWCAQSTQAGFVCPVSDPATGICCNTQTALDTISWPKYPLNRLYDPQRIELGTECTTTTNQMGTVVSKCSTLPTTCNFLYCVAN